MKAYTLNADGSTPWVELAGPRTCRIIDIAGGSAQLEIKGTGEADSELAPFGAAKTANEAFTVYTQPHEKMSIRFTVTGITGTFKARY